MLWEEREKRSRIAEMENQMMEKAIADYYAKRGMCKPEFELKDNYNDDKSNLSDSEFKQNIQWSNRTQILLNIEFVFTDDDHNPRPKRVIFVIFEQQ